VPITIANQIDHLGKYRRGRTILTMAVLTFMTIG
jgi:hypothetical protein